MSKSLSQTLKELLSAYYEEAPENVSYPYTVFSARRLTEDDGKQVYRLEVNVWDQGAYYSTASALMDELERKLHKEHFLTDGYLICFFKGERENVGDPDKTIKRVREQFTMHVFEREE